MIASARRRRPRRHVRRIVRRRELPDESRREGARRPVRRRGEPRGAHRRAAPPGTDTNELGLLAIVANAYMVAAVLYTQAPKLPAWTLAPRARLGQHAHHGSGLLLGRDPQPARVLLPVDLPVRLLLLHSQASRRRRSCTSAWPTARCWRPGRLPEGIPAWWLVGMGTLLVSAHGDHDHARSRRAADRAPLRRRHAPIRSPSSPIGAAFASCSTSSSNGPAAAASLSACSSATSTTSRTSTTAPAIASATSPCSASHGLLSETQAPDRLRRARRRRGVRPDPARHRARGRVRVGRAFALRPTRRIRTGTNPLDDQLRPVDLSRARRDRRLPAARRRRGAVRGQGQRAQPNRASQCGFARAAKRQQQRTRHRRRALHRGRARPGRGRRPALQRQRPPLRDGRALRGDDGPRTGAARAARQPREARRDPPRHRQGRRPQQHPAQARPANRRRSKR